MPKSPRFTKDEPDPTHDYSLSFWRREHQHEKASCTSHRFFSGYRLAAAIALAREGFSIAVNGPFDDEELHRAVETICNEVNAIAMAFDVSDISCHSAQLDAIETAIGPLNTLVNNAGVGVLQR